MNIGLLKEKLELKSFILDSNLYLIANSFYFITVIIGFLYYLVCLTYAKEYIDFFIFASASSMALVVSVFVYIGYKAIKKQRCYIQDLDSFLDTYLNEDGEYEIDTTK